MAKLVLDTIAKFDEISKINSNFDKIEAEFQDKVLYRNNPVGEPNTVAGDIDLNNKKIINAAEIRTTEITVGSVSLAASVASAGASATAAASSASAASASASAAATSASQAAAAADFIPEIANYATLRAYSGALTKFYVKGVTAIFDGGAGVFRIDSSDTTSADNGGTILVDASGRRWKREYTGSVQFVWFTAASNRAKLVAAMGLGGIIQLPASEITIESAFTVPAGVVLRGHGKGKTILKRAFTGDLITSFGSQSALEHLTIDGDTAMRGAGRGILFTGTSFGCQMLLAEIKNFVEACIDFGTDSGATFRALGCDFFTTGTAGTVAAVKVSGTDTQATSRHFYNCESSGCTLYDFGGCNDFYVSGGYTNGLIFSAASSKALITNVRIGVGGGTVTINGGSNKLSNCVFAGPVVISGTNHRFDCEVPNFDITDNSTGSQVEIKARSFTTTWTASGSAPSFGNSSVTSVYTRTGNRISCIFDITFGSTATYGTGTWAFSLPKADSVSIVQAGGGGFTQVGIGNNFQFKCRISPGAQKVEIFYVSAGALSNLDSSSRTWASSDNLRFSVDYICT